MPARLCCLLAMLCGVSLLVGSSPLTWSQTLEIGRAHV